MRQTLQRGLSMSKRLAAGLIVLAGGLWLVAAARAEEWPQWRGPFFNGSTTESGLPEKLDPKANAAWVTDMPGRSDGTPAVWGDRMFVSSMSGEGLLAICVDRRSGKVMWSNPVGDTSAVNRS